MYTCNRCELYWSGAHEYEGWFRDLAEAYPELVCNLHRGICAGTLDSLPHNGAVVTLLSVCGVSHREGYSDLFMVAIVGALLALAAVILLGSAFGSF